MSEFETNVRVRFPLRERSIPSEENDNKKKCDELAEPSFLLKSSVDRRKYLKEFDQVEQIEDPKDIQQIFESAELFYFQGLDSKAYEAYLRYIGSGNYNPHNLFVAYKNIGNIKIRSGDLEGAEEYYHKAYTINPDSDTLLVNLGTLEIQKKNLEKALERYRMAVDVNPRNSRGWIGLALAHREYGDIDLAWGNLERSLDIEPCDDTALELLVQWGIKDSRIDIAIEKLRNYLSINPNNIHMRLALIHVYIIGGRLSVARGFVEESLKLDPNNDDLLNIFNNLKTITAEELA